MLSHWHMMGTVGDTGQLQHWFPRLSAMCKEYASTCTPCAAATPTNPPPPMKTRELPKGPWEILAADFKGPIGGSKGYYFHVLIDTYSRYPEVAIVKSTSFSKLKAVLNQSWAAHGSPEAIIHDGGPPYNGKKWKEYGKQWGFESDLCTPYHPQSNGLAEKFMSSIVKVTHAAIAEGKEPKEEIYKFLGIYRNTKHPTTGKSPSSLLMKRKIRLRIPAVIKSADQDSVREEVKSRVA